MLHGSSSSSSGMVPMVPAGPASRLGQPGLPHVGPGRMLPGFGASSPPGSTLLSHDPMFGAASLPHHHHLHPHHHHHHPHHHPHMHLPQPEPPKPRFLFRMPRVVPNQKEKFESDELMKRHSREGEVRFTGFRDRPLLERQAKFIQSLREGHTEIAFIGTGFNLVLSFDTFTHGLHPPQRRQIDFDKEPGKVYIRAPCILNGVCVRWKGYLDMDRLDGVGCLEFDEETAKMEDALLREQVEAYNRRMKEFEEHRKQQQRHLAAFMGQHQAAMAAAVAAAASNAAAANAANASDNATVISSSNRNSSSSLDSASEMLKSEKIADIDLTVSQPKREQPEVSSHEFENQNA